MTFVCKYVALHVPALQEAERFYGEVFGLGCSSARARRWTAVGTPCGHTWTGAMPSRAASRWTCSRSAARDSRSRSSRDRRRLELYELCIGVAPPEIDEIGARIEKNGVALESGGTWLRFQDPFGFRWLGWSADDPFRSSSAIADRWIG